MAKKQQLTIKAPERPVSTAPVRPAQPIYELSTNVLDAAPTSVALLPEADTLSEQLRELAVRFIGARRRVGEALLEACRYMSEARAAAEEGQWYVFLRVTGTSPDSAETLLNIHIRASQHAAFAEKIRSGWLNQTVAGELAKPSLHRRCFSSSLSARSPCVWLMSSGHAEPLYQIVKSVTLWITRIIRGARWQLRDHRVVKMRCSSWHRLSRQRSPRSLSRSQRAWKPFPSKPTCSLPTSTPCIHSSGSSRRPQPSATG